MSSVLVFVQVFLACVCADGTALLGACELVVRPSAACAVDAGAELELGHGPGLSSGPEPPSGGWWGGDRGRLSMGLVVGLVEFVLSCTRAARYAPACSLW